MNPLALAIQAIQSKMAGGPNRPTVPGLNDPEAGLKAMGMDMAYGQPLMGNGVDVSAFNSDPADANMDGAVSAQEMLAKRMKESQKRLQKLKEENTVLQAKRDLAEQEWKGLTEKPDVKPKNRTDSQNFIPAAIALLARGLGARHEYVMPALGNYWGGVDQHNQAEADSQNEAARRQFALEAQKRALLLREAGDAVSRSSQDIAGLEGKIYDSENDLIGVLEKERGATERKKIERKTREYVADKNNWDKHPALVFAELEQIDPGNPDNIRKATSLRTLQVAKAGEADASAGLKTIQGEDNVATRESRIQENLAAGLKDRNHAALFAAQTEAVPEKMRKELLMLEVFLRGRNADNIGKAFENSPEKLAYGQLGKDYDRVEGRLKTVTKTLEDAEKALNSPDSYLMSKEARQTLMARRDDALREQGQIQAELNGLSSKMRDLNKKLVERAGAAQGKAGAP